MRRADGSLEDGASFVARFSTKAWGRDEAGRFVADEALFCKGSSRIVLRYGPPPRGDAKQIPTIFAIVRPHVLFLGSTLIGADLIAAKAIV